MNLPFFGAGKRTNLIRKTIRISKEEDEWLKEYCEVNFTAENGVVRLAINQFRKANSDTNSSQESN